MSVDGSRLSVRPVPRPKSRTKRPRKPMTRVTRFKVKSSKVKVTGPTTADTLNVPYLPNAKAYELQTW